MKINFANDLGYGYVKGYINSEYIKVPSVMAKENTSNAKDPVRFRNVNEKSEYINNLLKHLDLLIQSSSDPMSNRCLVGSSAERSSITNIDFNRGAKSTSNLSLTLTLGIIAGEAVKKHYQHYKALPKNDLKVNVNMVAALPINQGKHNKDRDAYSNRYTQCDHIVTIMNFENKITVHIHFNNVAIVLEGQAAVYDIKHAPEELDNLMEKYYVRHYPHGPQIESGNELTHVDNTLSIDIGYVTTDFAVFNGGSLDSLASRSIDYGFSDVLDQAVEDLPGINSVNDMEKILKSTGTFMKGRQNACKEAINNSRDGLVTDIINAVSKIFHIDKSVSIVYVYGGGSIPMESVLFKPLRTQIQSSNYGHDIPVIFIDKQYAQNLNVDGLEITLNYLINH